MKPLFLALALLFTIAQGAAPLSAYARQLNDFDGLMTALKGLSPGAGWPGEEEEPQCRHPKGAREGTGTPVGS